jgi:hypothetical protein
MSRQERGKFLRRSEGPSRFCLPHRSRVGWGHFPWSSLSLFSRLSPGSSSIRGDGEPGKMRDRANRDVPARSNSLPRSRSWANPSGRDVARSVVHSPSVAGGVRSAGLALLESAPLGGPAVGVGVAVGVGPGSPSRGRCSLSRTAAARWDGRPRQPSPEARKTGPRRYAGQAARNWSRR